MTIKLNGISSMNQSQLEQYFINSSYPLLPKKPETVSVKIAKSNKYNEDYLSSILYLAPHDNAGGITVCPAAIAAGCQNACLYNSGMAMAFNSIKAARIRKTLLWNSNRDLFLELLDKDIKRFIRYANKRNKQPVIRLNGTSDIAWYTYIDMSSYECVFYDYTKVLKRATETIPDNYHLTLSYSESRDSYAKFCLRQARDSGLNIAVVFRNKSFPKLFNGMKVVNGDEHDMRFLDPNDKPHVIALSAKGPKTAIDDKSGFIINWHKGNY